MPRIVIVVPDCKPQPYRFPPDCEQITLGRNEANDILIACGSVSQYHAEIVRVPGGFELRDAGSANGIMVDGELRTSVRLHHDHALALGEVTMFFQLSEEEQDALAKEGHPDKPQPSSQGTPASPTNRLPSRPSAVPRPKRWSPGAPGRSVKSRTSDLLVMVVLAILAFVAGSSLRYYLVSSSPPPADAPPAIHTP